MRQIVVDFGLNVNGYAALGRQIPCHKPETCPACDRARTLVSHGLRSRVAWVAKDVWLVFVRRLRCAARGGCGVVFTVLPSFLYPFRRYVLSETATVLEARFLEDFSFAALAERFTFPSPTTQRAHVAAFAAAAPIWLPELCGKFALSNPEMTLDREVEGSGPRGLLTMAIHGLDWFRELRNLGPVPRTAWLEELWLWASVRIGARLFPTRNRSGSVVSQGEGLPPPSS